METLAQVVDALGPEYAVMIDSGFRRGNDVLLALALGAKFVFVGRPFNYAGAVAGRRESCTQPAFWPQRSGAIWP